MNQEGKGWGSVPERQTNENGVRWTNHKKLREQGTADFCVLQIEGGSYDQNGLEQMVLTITYALKGQEVVERLSLAIERKGAAGEVIEYKARREHLNELAQHTTLHHTQFRELPPKPGSKFPNGFLVLVPNKELQGTPCVCDGAGIINPDDPVTWTEHMKLTVELNTFLAQSGRKEMDTASMSEEGLIAMLEMIGARVVNVQ